MNLWQRFVAKILCFIRVCAELNWSTRLMVQALQFINSLIPKCITANWSTHGDLMNKTIIALAILSSSATTFAQMSKSEKDYFENKLEGTLPEPHSVANSRMSKIHMGLMTGMTNPNGDAESSVEYGINVGFQPYVPFGLGAEVTTSELDNSKVQKTNLLVRGTYNLGGDIPVLRSSYLGVLAGPMFQSEDGDTEFSVGPTLGFDIPLQDKSNDFLSLGLSTKYLYTTEVQDSFAASLALKYWY